MPLDSQGLHISPASGDTAPISYSVGWDMRMGESLAADTVFSVTATNAAGTSAPATATVRVIMSGMPPYAGLTSVAGRNNRAKADVLTFTYVNISEQSEVVTVNRKRYAVLLKPTSDATVQRATLTLPDKNGARTTTYRVAAGGRKLSIRVR